MDIGWDVNPEGRGHEGYIRERPEAVMDEVCLVESWTNPTTFREIYRGSLL